MSRTHDCVFFFCVLMALLLLRRSHGRRVWRITTTQNALVLGVASDMLVLRTDVKRVRLEHLSIVISM